MKSALVWALVAVAAIALGWFVNCRVASSIGPKREAKNMNCAMPIKSVSPDNKRDNMFFREITKEYKRLSIQTDSEEKIQEILLLFLSKCVDPVDILVKVHSGEYTKEDEIIWNYYLGNSYRKELLQEITKFHNSIYHDGNFQFLVKDPKTQEYLCLDDHGILFLYMENYEEILNLINGFLEVDSFSEYITGGQHWHYRFKDAEKYLDELIKQLKLTEG